MKIFSVVGLTGSGKTSVIEKLIAELVARGFSVGSVKEIHFEAFRIDQEGKNTRRHRQAGSDTVTARSHHETDIMYQGHLNIYDVLSHYNQDYVVLEGVRDVVCPVISVCKEDEKPVITPLTIAVSGRFSNNDIKEYEKLPVINAIDDAKRLVDLIVEKVPSMLYDIDPECCKVCGSDCRGFLADVLLGKRDIKECVLMSSNVNLKIDDKDIVMVPFVENILRNAVIGVVKELIGYKKGGKVSIEFLDKE